MIALDQDALICDLAEVYHIYDYKSLPLQRVATFAVGLRENSRIKMKMNGTSHSFERMLLATIADKLALIAWMNTKDGMNGENKPGSILMQLLGENDKMSEEDMETFHSPEDYERRRQEVIGGVKSG